jgi:hypothetical protein
MNTQELISQIKSNDEKTRGQAWQEAGPVGSAAVQPLAVVAAEGEFEAARAATRALWMIVRYAGRPGADGEREKVVSELLVVLGQQRSPRLRSDVIWMLSEIAGDEAVATLAALLTDRELREDARMGLERIEGQASLAALRTALASAPEDFKTNLASSLRHRGVETPGVPCEKLKPSKPTRVARAGAAARVDEPQSK